MIITIVNLSAVVCVTKRLTFVELNRHKVKSVHLILIDIIIIIIIAGHHCGTILHKK